MLTFCYSQIINFAQWQYHSQWGLSEAWLLLVENYTQYPAPSPWKMGGCAIFLRPYEGNILKKSKDKNDRFLIAF